MFVIFGVGPKEKIEATGIFVCPRCRIKREYKVKSSVEYFRLFLFRYFLQVRKKNPMLSVKAARGLITRTL